MRPEPVLDGFGLMSREVIEDDVNLFFGAPLDHGGKKLAQLNRAVTFAASTDHLAGGYFQSGIKGASSMTHVFKAAPLGCPGAQGQKRLDSIQCLDGALFIHAKDGRLLRRLQIKANDLFGFGGKIRVVARHVSALSMRLEASSAPDFLHRVEADSVTPRHQATGPMTSASRWPHAQRIAQNALVLAKAHAPGPSGAGPIDQSVHPAQAKTLSPFDDVAQIEPGAFTDSAQRGAFAQQQHGLDPTSDALRNQPRAQELFHLLPLG